MKFMAVTVLFLILTFSLSLGDAQQNDFPILKGAYLEQKPPGMTPELFAPGIISTPAFEYGIAFSKDSKEIYLKRMGRNLVFCYEDATWDGAREVEFGDEGRYAEFHLTPDGKYLLANRIESGADGNPQSMIVRFLKSNGIWTSPVMVGHGMRATSTGKGDIYVTHVLDVQKSLGAIGVFRCLDGEYAEIDILEGDINIENVSSAHPFIAPDESYLIFDSERAGDSLGCLYISFSHNGDTWSRPQNLSTRLNTGVSDNEWHATVSPDGLYLFYNVGGDIYWVSAAVIDELRPKE